MRRSALLLALLLAPCSLTHAQPQDAPQEAPQNPPEEAPQETPQDAPETAPPDATPAAVQAPQFARESLDALLDAIARNDLENYTRVFDEALRPFISDTSFKPVVEGMKPRLDGGYETTYFGELKQKGHVLYFWRATFKDGGDDLLMQLSVKDGKVVGFFLR